MANLSPQEFFGGGNTQLPQGAPQTQPQPAAPGVVTSVAPQQFFNGTTSPQQPAEPGFFSNIASGNIAGAAKNAMDFAFPIISDLGEDVVGKSHKSVMQQIGDAGLSALWFIPGFGDAADVGIHAGLEGGAELAAHEAPGVLAKVAGSNIAKGAAVGYGADVASKLSSGDNNAQSVLTPGFGTITGGIAGSIFPKLSKILGQNFTQEGALQSLQENLGTAFRGTKAGAKFLSAAEALGHDPTGLMAHSMAIPDVIDTKFSTTAAQKVIQDNIDKLSQFRAQAFDSMNEAGALNIQTPSIQELKDELVAKATKQFSGTAQSQIVDHLNSEFDAYAQQFGENPTVSNLEKIKEDLYSKSNYDATRPGMVTQANKLGGNHIKTLIEDLSGKAGFPEMKAYNNLIAQHYTALDGLNLLDGNTIKGGRLGNMLRGHTVAGISAVAGGAMGGGFLGTLAAGAAGEGLSTLYSKILGDSTLLNPWQERILNKIATENPSVVQKLQALIGSTADVAPQLVPKSSETIGKLGDLMTKTTTIAGSKLNANGHATGQQVRGGDGNMYTVNEKGNYVLAQ